MKKQHACSSLTILMGMNFALRQMTRKEKLTADSNRFLLRANWFAVIWASFDILLLARCAYQHILLHTLKHFKCKRTQIQNLGRIIDTCEDKWNDAQQNTKCFIGIKRVCLHWAKPWAFQYLPISQKECASLCTVMFLCPGMCTDTYYKLQQPLGSRTARVFEKKSQSTKKEEKKTLKQECIIDLFYREKCEPSLVLHCQCLTFDWRTTLQTLRGNHTDNCGLSSLRCLILVLHHA